MPASLQSCATGLPAALPASICLRISMICSGLRLAFFMGVPLRITLTLRGPGRGGQTTIGLYKAELIRASGRAWASRQEIETATTAWVAWFNERCLHSRLGYLSPVKYEAAYNQNLHLPRQAA